jgi:hypothetical protein
MNDYDKAGRYLVKRDPEGFFRWLLENPTVGFQTWVDARRVALPNQADLTNDLVAVLRSTSRLEAICLELEAQARADALPRLFGYMARVWSEPTGPGSVALSCVTGAILDLTGRSPAREIRLVSQFAPGCRMEVCVLRRHLADEHATAVVAKVAAGNVSPWLLGWIPLMNRAGESSIIAQWCAEAECRFRDERDRADLGSLTLTLAVLAGHQPAWRHGLRRWNVQTSPFLDEIRAEGRQEGRQEGLQEGRTQGVRAMILRLGRQKFGKEPTKKQERQLAGVADPRQLEKLAERVLRVDSWADLLTGL